MQLNQIDNQAENQIFNLEAEMRLLGAILIENQVLLQVNSIIESTDFYEPLHQRIFKSISDWFDQQKLASPVTLKPFFINDPAIIDISNENYLTQLAAESVGVVTPREYAAAIKDLALRRAHIKINQQYIDRVKAMRFEDATAILLDNEADLASIAEVKDVNAKLKPFNTGLDNALQVAQEAHRCGGLGFGIPTNLITLDSIIGGLMAPDLIIMAARPSMGKTALATIIAFRTALKNKNVAFFSLEMSQQQLVLRILSNRLKISVDTIIRGNLSNETMTDLILAAEKIKEAKLFIDDDAEHGILSIKSRVKKLAAKLEKSNEKVDLIVIDYLQLIETASNNKNYSKANELTDITKALKGLAKTLNCPVIVLSQLNRKCEERSNKRPQLGDLRDSGSIEQDADIVIFIYRDEYYLKREEPESLTEEYFDWSRRLKNATGKAELIVAKNRNGRVGTAQVAFDEQFTRFSNLSAS
jgi:replicative DNA helicase